MLIFPLFNNLILFVCWCEQDGTLVVEADEEDNFNLDVSTDHHSWKGYKLKRPATLME